MNIFIHIKITKASAQEFIAEIRIKRSIQLQVLLNASVKTICDKVYFAEQGMNEPTDTALYVQPSVQGNSVIFPNTENEETNLNLEVLFNAMLAEREKMQTMFNK